MTRLTVRPDRVRGAVDDPEELRPELEALHGALIEAGRPDLVHVVRIGPRRGGGWRFLYTSRGLTEASERIVLKARALTATSKVPCYGCLRAANRVIAESGSEDAGEVVASACGTATAAPGCEA